MKKLRLLVALCTALLTSTLIGCGGPTAPLNVATPQPATPPPPAAPIPPTPPSNATTISNIQQLSGWENCTGTCTNSPLAVFSMTQGVASPSLSGASAQFELLAGTQPFGSALWFKYLGSFDNATHFVYDLFFYVDNPSASQALEFNVSQSANGSWYNFATQCDLAGQQVWRVWEPVAQTWIPSSVPCERPAPNT